MLDFVRRRFKKDDSKKHPRKEFSLRARTQEAECILMGAAEVAQRITEIGMIFQQKGFSTGGFTAEIATSSGQKDGPPKMDPVTVEVRDKTGQPLFTVELFMTATGDDFNIKGGNAELQEKLKSLPPGMTPHEQVESVMSALTPQNEIGASVASVMQGRLVFGGGHLAGVVAANEAAAAERAAEETAARERETVARERAAVRDATVLQSPTTVGAPLKLKTPKA